MVCEDFWFSWDFSTLHHSHPWFSQGFPRVCRELSKPLLRASSPLSTLAGAGAEERRSLPLKLWTFIHIQALCAFCFGVLYCFTVVQRFIIVQGDASSGPCFMLCCASHCFTSLMATCCSLQGDACALQGVTSRSPRPCFMLRALQDVAACSSRRCFLLRAQHAPSFKPPPLVIHINHC